MPLNTASFVRFQFHKGTIRTNESLYVVVQTILFQFHKGTIRTKIPHVDAALYRLISIP